MEAQMTDGRQSPESIAIDLIADVQNRRSFVTSVWHGSDKRIALPVSYSTTLDDVHRKAGRAVRAFASTFSNIHIRRPDAHRI